MRILVAGNMGYIGPGIVRELRMRWPGAVLIGLDIGFFAHCLTTTGTLPELLLDRQIFADVREITPETFPPCDVVVYLAALSNDVLGDFHEEATLGINYRSAIRLAGIAKDAGARAFVFASTCSVYGFAEDAPRDERSPVDPLTVYARSKVLAERDLELLADESFLVSCLRFGTACGMSERLRLDLVLNDFVAAAITSGEIRVMSDGTPWRPMIDVRDMARATAWTVARRAEDGGAFLIANVGSPECNMRVRDLAERVASLIDGTTIRMNPDAQPDRRSYRVDFSRFQRLAPDAMPRVGIEESVRALVAGLKAIGFRDAAFHRSPLMRIETLKRLRDAGRLTADLGWARV
jgi:nucleoside-diphosphate-sugar epimerase